jgi:hypothetical protein
MKRSVTFALLIALAALPTTGAQAVLPAQTDARTDPVVTGPLALSDKACSRIQERILGELVAYTKTCIRLYTFNNNQETDLQRDYGVAWLQATVNAENGWCATTVRTDLKIPNGVTIHKRNPVELRTAAQPKVITNKMTTTAAGNSMTKASVAQSYIFRPRKAERVLANEGATQRLVWTGKTPAKLFFQTGVVFSWNILESPGEFRSGLGFRFEKAANC